MMMSSEERRILLEDIAEIETARIVEFKWVLTRRRVEAECRVTCMHKNAGALSDVQPHAFE